jgi:DNA sulfur modification protein DndB
MDARFAIHDGNHRRAAFELALSENPELGYETIALILFLDIGLKRSQQMCLDVNSYQVPLDPSLTILYDHRDEKASLVRAVIKEVPVFRTLTDMERSTLPSRSGKLFTLSSVYNATLALLADCQKAELNNPPDYVPLRYHSPLKGGMLEEQLSKQIELAARYWNTVTRYIPGWEQVLEKKVSAGEVRRDYVHCHAIAIAGLGRVGASLFSIYPEGWDEHLGGLARIDWSRSNPDWQGRIMSKGGISQSQSSVSRMTAYIKKYLGLPLTVEEERLVDAPVAARKEN